MNYLRCNCHYSILVEIKNRYFNFLFRGGHIYTGERPAIFAGYLIRINKIESMIDTTFLTYYLNTHFAKRYGSSVRSFGVNQSNINGTKLKTYPIPLCQLEEQQLIVNELESKLTVCDKIEETISQSLQQAETLKQSILKKVV